MDPFDKPWLKFAAVESEKTPPSSKRGGIVSARIKGTDSSSLDLYLIVS